MPGAPSSRAQTRPVFVFAAGNHHIRRRPRDAWRLRPACRDLCPDAVGRRTRRETTRARRQNGRPDLVTRVRRAIRRHVNPVVNDVDAVAAKAACDIVVARLPGVRDESDRTAHAVPILKRERVRRRQPQVAHRTAGSSSVAIASPAGCRDTDSRRPRPGVRRAAPTAMRRNRRATASCSGTVHGIAGDAHEPRAAAGVALLEVAGRHVRERDCVPARSQSFDDRQEAAFLSATPRGDLVLERQNFHRRSYRYADAS